MDSRNNYRWLEMYSVSSFSVVQPLDNWSHQCVEKKDQKSEVSFKKTSFWYYLQIGHLVFIFSIQSFIHFWNLSEVSKYFGATIYLCNVLFIDDCDDHSVVCDDHWFSREEVFVGNGPVSQINLLEPETFQSLQTFICTWLLKDILIFPLCALSNMICNQTQHWISQSFSS